MTSPATAQPFNYIQYLGDVRAAVLAYRANAPLPAPAPMTMDEARAAISSAAEKLPGINAWIATHPGAITAVIILLQGLEKQGVTEAADIEQDVGAAPGALATVADWLPRLSSALEMIAPAPIGLPGGWGGARGHIL